MSILCSICQEFLTERPAELPAATELIICSLRCGHLFHQECLKTWFGAQNERAGQPRLGAPTQSAGSCPCCKKTALLSEAIRIFPTGDEDSNSVVELKKSRDKAISDNEKLTAELNAANDEISRRSAVLEEEMVAHDMLKMEYGQALSKLEAVQERMTDNSKLHDVLENSAKAEIEKLLREKMDAMNIIREMEAREKQLIDEMESLRVGNKENNLNTLQRVKAANQIIPRETTLQKISINLNTIKTECDGTSDGESPAASPLSGILQLPTSQNFDGTINLSDDD